MASRFGKELIEEFKNLYKLRDSGDVDAISIFLQKKFESGRPYTMILDIGFLYLFELGASKELIKQLLAMNHSDPDTTTYVMIIVRRVTKIFNNTKEEKELLHRFIDIVLNAKSGWYLQWSQKCSHWALLCYIIAELFETKFDYSSLRKFSPNEMKLSSWLHILKEHDLIESVGYESFRLKIHFEDEPENIPATHLSKKLKELKSEVM